MAFSDWNYIVGGTGGTTGTQTPILNSTLSSPLTVGSSYCRRLYNSPNGYAANNGSYTSFVISSGFSSGAFYNIPNTKAIRIQSYIRMEAGSNGIACIGAKIPSSGGITQFDGYLLAINTSGQVLLYTEGVASSVLTNVSLNVWHHLRLEVFPIGSGSDRIRAYIESGGQGSNVWTTLADIILNNPSTGYVNWSENRRVGFGVTVDFYNAGIISYFDNFSASIANAPTPIP